MYFLKQIHSYAGNRLYVNLLAMMFISLLDGLGILLLIPMISMSGIVSLDTGNSPVSGIFSFFQYIPSTIGLPIILAIYVLIVTGQNVIQRHITIQNNKIQQGFSRYLRIDTYESLLHANWSFFINHRKSDLINILTAEIARSSAGTHSFLQFMASLIFTCIQICLALLLSPNITVFVLLCGLVLLIFNRKFLKRSLALGNQNYSLGREYLSGVTDQINGIKDIKSNTLEQSRMDWFRTITKGMQDEQIEYTNLKTTSQMYYKIASAVLIAVFIFIAVGMFNAQASQLMLIIVIFSRLWPRVAGIQGSLEQIATTIPSFKVVKAFQEECRNAQEFTVKENDELHPMKIDKGIECKNVFFRYHQNSSASYALKDINLIIPVNKMTAIVGPSGAGKSTLIDILMGLNTPENGQVLIDGNVLSKDNLLSLRSSFSYVPQDPFLFNMSIKENMLIVQPEATETQIWEALEFAAADFVKNLPNGLDTMIGDRGIRLSGGERQRIVLARAILRKPSVLVLDEATSALDTENEAKVQEAIDRLKGKMTIIVIAHRLSTIRHAEQVIVLEEGRIVQQGEYYELAKDKKNVFGKLLGKQLEVIG